MRRIVRQFLVRDPAGRTLSGQSERVTDDGKGLVRLTSERSAGWCSGCRRPVTELSELRGICDWCHTGGCCVHCLSQCQVCSRRLCGHCRRGFPGPPAITVCAICQQRLIQRQLLEDEQSEFEREVTRHRMCHQDLSLKLMHERMQMTAKLQTDRLGLNKTTLLGHILHGVRWTAVALFKVVCHAVDP